MIATLFAIAAVLAVWLIIAALFMLPFMVIVAPGRPPTDAEGRKIALLSVTWPVSVPLVIISAFWGLLCEAYRGAIELYNEVKK